MSQAARLVKEALLEIQEYMLLLAASFRALVTPPYYRADIIRQFETIGIGSLTVVSLTGFFTGAALALQTGQTLDRFGARTLVGQLVSASMIRELGPVLTALMLAGRVGSGIAAELGSMVVTDQINALRALGTDPVRKLVVPRVMAATMMAPVLTVIADAFALVAGWVISVSNLGVGSSTYWTSVLDGLYLGDAWQGVIKPIVLGFVIGSVGCHVGLRAGGGTQGVGRATTQAVVVASVLVIAADFFLTPLLMRVLYYNAMAVARQPMRSGTESQGAEDPVVVFDRVSLAFDDNVVLRDISFTLLKGHTKVFLGASGSGKSTILKLIVGLFKPDAGTISVNGERVDNKHEAQLMKVREDLGMVFQEGALFDSLTVAENVGYKLLEEGVPEDRVWQRVDEVLGFIGLGEFTDRMPSELSGGQRRRVAIARAMAYKPRILLYDEATTGLDPITADAVNNEIIKLRDLEEISSIVVTHQLRDAFRVATHEAVRNGADIRIEHADEAKCDEAEFIMLKDGGIHFEGNAGELRASTDPYVRLFLS